MMIRMRRLRSAQCCDSLYWLAAAVAGAQVDLNPHQVDAALFAFKSPLSKGALLADEVGLGKTIEAGLVLSQKWAERKRRILVITPSNLRKQWHQELTEKFFLPCRILEAKSYNEAIKHGQFRPFEVTDTIVICSYQFARSKAADVATTPWDLVVIDEAHRLRNVYKPSNVIANTLKRRLPERHKLLLTATPLQNSLLELFGLVSIIDEHAFGDLKSFREQFANLTQEQVFRDAQGAAEAGLPSHTAPAGHRLHSVTRTGCRSSRSSPQRKAKTGSTTWSPNTCAAPNLQALPASQRSLMTLVLRKLLASSTFAIAGALDIDLEPAQGQARASRSRRNRWKTNSTRTTRRWTKPPRNGTTTSPASRCPTPTARPSRRRSPTSTTSPASPRPSSTTPRARRCSRRCTIAFAQGDGARRARRRPSSSPSRAAPRATCCACWRTARWQDGIVLFNGSNTDERSKPIYAAWLERHQGTDRVTGSRTADMRSALVDYFREQGRIMIATEAGAEGINLQFCSLVVNYDLPWNPQRIEQRIGRCHRYGQKHDVVVVNFLNRKNAADQRVFELLSEKFQLFEGVFGASDEVLGAIESRRGLREAHRRHLPALPQTERDQDRLRPAPARTELRDQRGDDPDPPASCWRTSTTRCARSSGCAMRPRRPYLDRFEQLLMRLTRHELNGHAEFLRRFLIPTARRARLPVADDIPLGLYELPRRIGEAHTLPPESSAGRGASSRRRRGASCRRPRCNSTTASTTARSACWSRFMRARPASSPCRCFTVESLDQAEDHLIFAAVTDDGELLDEEAARAC